jgi:hypothetical protein
MVGWILTSTQNIPFDCNIIKFIHSCISHINIHTIPPSNLPHYLCLWVYVPISSLLYIPCLYLPYFLFVCLCHIFVLFMFLPYVLYVFISPIFLFVSISTILYISTLSNPFQAAYLIKFDHEQHKPNILLGFKYYNPCGCRCNEHNPIRTIWKKLFELKNNKNLVSKLWKHSSKLLKSNNNNVGWIKFDANLKFYIQDLG